MLEKQKYLRMRKSLLNMFSEYANRLDETSPYNDVEIKFVVNKKYDSQGLLKPE